MRRRLLVPALAVAVLAAPAGANAATSVDLTGDTLTVTGDAFANRIEVRRVSDGYLVRDPLATLAIETPSRCRFTSTASVHDAKCTLASEADVRIEGRAGDDALTVVGGTRGAILDGENGADTLTGGPGPETLRGGPGGDDFHGGGGIDTVTYSERINAAVNITLPVDALDVRADDGNVNDGVGANSRDTIFADVENAIGGAGPDTIVGNNARNVLSGRGDADTLNGRGGDDLLNGGREPDTINGDAGVDQAFYGDRSDPVTVTLDGLPNDGDPANDRFFGSGRPDDLDNVGTDVEGMVGGDAGDTLIGDDRANLLEGGDGNDTIDGRAGADRLEGGTGDDAFDGGTGADDLRGGTGVDTVSYESRVDAVRVTLDDLADDGSAQDLFTENVHSDVENVIGTVQDDLLRGSGAANLLDGRFGDDRIEGLGGNDTLDGRGGSDVLDGGVGVDTVTYAGNVPVRVTLDGIANDGATEPVLGPEVDNVLAENVIGSNGADIIIGDDGPNVLTGLGGADTLRGAGGNDNLRANDGVADDLNCGAGIDSANADLADRGPVRSGGTFLPATAECELQDLAPAGQLPNVGLAAKVVRVDGGRAHVALLCPRRSHRRCAGVVRLQTLNGADLGRARFAIGKGTRQTVGVRLRPGVRSGRAQIVARERDASGREKLTRARVRLRRP